MPLRGRRYPWRRRSRPRGLGGGRIDVEDRNGSTALGALRAIESDRSSLRRLGEARALQHREGQEYVAAAVRRDDKAEALIAVEPLDGAGETRGVARRQIALRRPEISHELTNGSS